MSPEGRPPLPERLRAQKQVVLARLFWAQITLIGVLTVYALLVRLGGASAGAGESKDPGGAGFLTWFADLGTFWPALLVGAVGGSVGLLRRVRAGDPEVIEESAASRVAALMPIVYGGLMAAVAYALFLSQVVSGTLFPAFTGTSVKFEGVATFFDMHLARGADFGKLIVWSFVAGYSENFVTGLLGRLQRDESAEAEHGSDTADE